MYQEQRHRDYFWAHSHDRLQYWSKLVWFIKEPLYNSLNLWEIFPDKNNAIVVISFLVLSGFLVLFRILRSLKGQTDKRRAVLNLFFISFLFLSLILLSFLPNLAAAGNAPFYRCCSALTAMVVIIIICALQQWITILPERAGEIIMTGLLFLSCLYGVNKASSNVLNYRVIPSHAELVFIKKYMEQAVARKCERINVNLPRSRFMKHRYDEFGGFSTNWSDLVYPMITCALRELAHEQGLDLKRFTFNQEGHLTYVFSLFKVLNG